MRGVICCDCSDIFMPAFWIQNALKISMDIIYSVKILAIFYAKGLSSMLVWPMTSRGTYWTKEERESEKIFSSKVRTNGMTKLRLTSV